RWIALVFEHPEDDARWYERRDTIWWDGDESRKAEFTAEMFENAGRHLARFSDEQLENGLRFFLSQGYAFDALDADVPLPARVRLVRAVPGLYRGIFAPRCHELDFGGNLPLYRICYMFWESIPVGGRPESEEERTLGREMLAALREILEIDNPMCQYSALHGLGHARPDWPVEVEEMIDAYLSRQPRADFPLRTYALAAREGHVQ
ncbi:MAG: hypothetical protein KGJ84_16110, partial [Elusimicrobia bacterium]|nr:hypothetical protein [Elusimicrobiota bacterium]